MDVTGHKRTRGIRTLWIDARETQGTVKGVLYGHTELHAKVLAIDDIVLTGSSEGEQMFARGEALIGRINNQQFSGLEGGLRHIR